MRVRTCLRDLQLVASCFIVDSRSLQDVPYGRVDAPTGAPTEISPRLATGVKPEQSKRLQCVECGRKQANGERGWRAYLADDEDEPARRSSAARRAPSANSGAAGLARSLWAVSRSRLSAIGPSSAVCCAVECGSGSSCRFRCARADSQHDRRSAVGAESAGLYRPAAGYSSYRTSASS
jgi:hypothetical protein